MESHCGGNERMPPIDGRGDCLEDVEEEEEEGNVVELEADAGISRVREGSMSIPTSVMIGEGDAVERRDSRVMSVVVIEVASLLIDSHDALL
jgi:hypothetical protein